MVTKFSESKSTLFQSAWLPSLQVQWAGSTFSFLTSSIGLLSEELQMTCLRTGHSSLVKKIARALFTYYSFNNLYFPMLGS